MDDQLVVAAQTPKILAGLLSAFALVAPILVAVGRYGILSGYVNNRVAEIGVGIGLSLLFGTVLAKFPASLRTNEPVLLALVALGFLSIAVIPCVIPAWRASRVDPATVLRHE